MARSGLKIDTNIQKTLKNFHRLSWDDVKKIIDDNAFSVDELKDKYVSELLHYAVRSADITTMRIILAAYAELDIRFEREQFRKGIVSVPVIEIRDGYGDLPIFLAMEDRDNYKLKLLLEAKANPNVLNLHAITPVSFAAKKGHVDRVEMLIEAKASISPKSKEQEKLFINEELSDYRTIVDFISGRKSLIKQMTPLHYAAEEGHVDVVKLLIEKRADLEAKNIDSKTGLQLAQNRNHRSVVELIKQYLPSQVQPEDVQAALPYALEAGEEDHPNGALTELQPEVGWVIKDYKSEKLRRLFSNLEQLSLPVPRAFQHEPSAVPDAKDDGYVSEHEPLLSRSAKEGGREQCDLRRRKVGSGPVLDKNPSISGHRSAASVIEPARWQAVPRSRVSIIGLIDSFFNSAHREPPAKTSERTKKKAPTR